MRLVHHLFAQEFGGANVVFGDVTNLDSLRQTAFSGPVDVVVSCLASRTGGKKDSWDIDYQVWGCMPGVWYICRQWLVSAEILAVLAQPPISKEAQLVGHCKQHAAWGSSPLSALWWLACNN